MKTKFLIVIFFALLFAGFAGAQGTNTAVIYKSESCGHCTPYIENLRPLLQSEGFSIVEKDFVNDMSARAEVVALHQKNNVPINMQGHMVTVINGSLILEGHVPMSLIQELTQKYPSKDFPKIVVYDDSMGAGDAPEPFSIMIDGKVVQCSAGTKISDCAALPGNFVETSLPLLVLSSGLVAGIHPCTIGVLLFFIAFLFTINRTRLNALKVGAAYILGVFSAYFLIGLGVLKAISFPEPHFAAKIAAILIIALGVFNIIRFFVPKIRGFGIPGSSKEWISGRVQKASVVSALVLGIFVGICSFGCTAGIYLSIIGFLITMPSTGIFYLLVYNIMFVLPLIIILLLTSNKNVVERMEKVKAEKIRYVSLVAGIFMVVSGIVLWFLVS